MNISDDPRGKLPEGEPASSKEVERLKSQIQDMRLLARDNNHAVYSNP